MPTNVYTIYKVSNRINGKVYIGFTSKKASRRLVEHKSCSRQGKGYLLHKAIRKYGISNFEFEEIYQSGDYGHTLHVMEPHFIKEYDSFISGYNQTFGGQGGMCGKRHSEASKEKMRVAWSKREDRTSPFFGMAHSSATKLRMSEKKQGKEPWNKGKVAPWTSERNKQYKGRSWKFDPTLNKRVWL